MKKKQTGLGRGLSALIDDAALAEASGEIRSLPLHKIEPNPLQPRREFDPEALQTLADSIAAHGLIQPLSVREMPNGYYQIIAGERRWRAARMANLDEVPVLVLDADDRTVMELALVENLQREDLNPMEEAAGFQTLMDEYGLTPETIAERVGRSRSAVANSLRRPADYGAPALRPTGGDPMPKSRQAEAEAGRTAADGGLHCRV